MCFYQFDPTIFMQSTKNHQIWNLRVQISRNRYFTCPISKISISRKNVNFLVERGSLNQQKLIRILLIFNSKHQHILEYLVSKFEENPTKIATVRVPQGINAKWPPWRHQIWTLENRKKCHWQISVRSFVESFIKIGSSV